MEAFIIFVIIILLALIYSGMKEAKNKTLLQSATNGDILSVNRMLDKKADINTRNRYGDTPLHLSIKNKHTETAEVLISRGANLNAKGELDDTPLHVSIYQNQTNITKLLKQKGADDSLLNRYDLKPSEMKSIPDIERDIVEAAKLLTQDGSWTDKRQGRRIYDKLRVRQNKHIVNSIVLQIIKNHEIRSQILLLAIKFGIKDSEKKLVSLLMVYGDRLMAANYLNSGSITLEIGGREWAEERGFHIRRDFFGSHDASWGKF